MDHVKPAPTALIVIAPDVDDIETPVPAVSEAADGSLAVVPMRS